LFRLRRAKSYLDWVMPAYLRHPDCKVAPEDWIEGMDFRFSAEESKWSLAILTRDDALQTIEEEQKLAEEQKTFFDELELSEEQTVQREEVFRILGWQYSCQKETGLPAKLSISEIKRKYQEEMSGELQTSLKPIRLPEKQQTKGLTGAEIGTAMHTVLEECDLRKEYEKDTLEALILELVQKGRLTEEEAKVIRRRELLQFFRSDLAKRLRASDQIETERTSQILVESRGGDRRPFDASFRRHRQTQPPRGRKRLRGRTFVSFRDGVQAAR
jgi:ATP-dependent helicase/nuclease subunit A